MVGYFTHFRSCCCAVPHRTGHEDHGHKEAPRQSKQPDPHILARRSAVAADRRVDMILLAMAAVVERLIVLAHREDIDLQMLPFWVVLLHLIDQFRAQDAGETNCGHCGSGRE